MTLGAAIHRKLQGNAALVALVADRIYPVTTKGPVAAPRIIWQGVGSEPVTTHGEASELRFNNIQFACFAETYEQAAAIRELLIDALDNETLATGAIGILEDGNRDDFDQAAELYRCDADFRF